MIANGSKSPAARRPSAMGDDELRAAYLDADAVCTEAEAQLSTARTWRRTLADEMARRERERLGGAA